MPKPPEIGPYPASSGDAQNGRIACIHLQDERKRALFGEIHSLLVPGGVFINLDLVASATPEAGRVAGEQNTRASREAASDDP